MLRTTDGHGAALLVPASSWALLTSGKTENMARQMHTESQRENNRGQRKEDGDGTLVPAEREDAGREGGSRDGGERRHLV